MNYFLFGFCLTLISTILWPDVPGPVWFPGLICLALLTLKRQPVIAGCLIATLYFSLCLYGMFSSPTAVWSSYQTDDKPASSVVRGEIISLVSGEGDWLGANIRLLNPGGSWPAYSAMRLSWPEPPTVNVGEVWEFRLRVKGIAAVLNEGGFNQQKYFLSHHIIAKGRVLEATLLATPQSLRQRLLTSMAPLTASMKGGDLLLALMMGETGQLSDERWQQLRQTGTGHLVAISGLHLTVVSSWVYLLGIWLLGWLWPSQGRRNLLLALGAAAMCATFYAAMAGFGLPTVRALVMLLMVLLLMVSKRFASPWERLLYALFAVLLLDPLSPLSAGFWLSFAALAIILLTLRPLMATHLSQSERLRAGVLAFIRLQLLLSLGLGALQAWLFGAISPYSILVNLLMVPWFSLVVIPLTLLGALISALGLALGIVGNWPLLPAQWGVMPLLWLLHWSDSWPFAWLTLPEAWQWALSAVLIAGLLYWLLPGRRMLALMPLLPLGFAAAQWGYVSAAGDNAVKPWQVDVLDVGQGLAVVISREHRAVIYDTGAAYGRFTYASRSILPFLAARGLTQVDYLIVSHGDNDHAGGAALLRQTFPDAVLITNAGLASDPGVGTPELPGSELPELGKRAGVHPCRLTQWQWQGIELTILGPQVPLAGNDGSCVLKVSDGRFSLLLPGDIELAGEMALLQSAKALSAQVLVAPHHGSRTSSSTAFIQAVSPELALFPAGYANQYGFPKADVLQRYRDLGIATLTTGEQGQISIRVYPARQEWQVLSYRTNMAPFWYNRLFEFGEGKKGR
ncbi:DNA internalization-related competence protein ComEC/Rec2 [Shewanella sp. GXUN23E]|uniref:DNA internalization-related competence protein ComEC/Rec2 n=1 Tax=Shewanella sp. GXUN23E TaxID=3422498 RepID=UPI003D7C84BF